MLGKYLFIVTLTGLLMGCNDPSAQTAVNNEKKVSSARTEKVPAKNYPELTSVSGSYLSGRFAQHNHDWQKASKYLGHVIREDSKNYELKKRSMVLAMGSGNPEEAIALAKELHKAGRKNALVQLFMALESFKSERYTEAVKYLDAMPEGGMADFINPLLKAWAKASQGKLAIKQMPENPVHKFHAALIASYLGKDELLFQIVDKALESTGISIKDMESAGDIYSGAGLHEKALEAYSAVIKHNPDNEAVRNKLASLKAGKQTSRESGKIDTTKEGLARALYDMATILFSEYSDDSARVFSQMALYLDPEMDNARILIAAIDTRNNRYKEAIEQYRLISEENNSWNEALKRSAKLMALVGRMNEAVSVLKELVKESGDIDAQIQIGDIYREKEKFEEALEAYDIALNMIKDEKEPAKYWNLYYARGMTLERLHRWGKAEQDLLKALEYEPEHPYIMNYLGYGWAEQGVNYERALELLHKAASIQPEDGYISDSLGWLYYKMGEYQKAITYLEKSVELMPYDPVINDHLGDAYWQAGRRLEAEFQWRRARNFSEDENMMNKLREKLLSGLKEPAQIKEAKGGINEN